MNGARKARPALPGRAVMRLSRTIAAFWLAGIFRIGPYSNQTPWGETMLPARRFRASAPGGLQLSGRHDMRFPPRCAGAAGFDFLLR